MIWHPLSLTVLALDLLALVLTTAALPAALDVAAGWAPGSAAADQLRREARAETLGLLGRWALLFFFGATVVWIVAVCDDFPRLVPGAMCGTGVLQAMAELGPRALALRLAALGVGYQWAVVDGLHRRLPEATLAPGLARLFCALAPLLLLGALDTFQGLAHLNTRDPVSCCSVVYDRFRSLDEARSWIGLSDRTLVAASLVLLTALLTAAGAVLHRPRRTGRAAVFATAGLLWTAAAAVTLVRVLAAYYYGVLHHHCPWCLFLPEHHRAGYLLFGLLAVTAAEAPAALVAARLPARRPDLVPVATRRTRRAAAAAALAAVLFSLLTFVPPLVWRWRFGVWMGG